MSQSYPSIASDAAAVRDKIDTLIDDPREVAKLITALAWRKLHPQAQVAEPSSFKPDEASRNSLVDKLINAQLPSTQAELYWAVCLLVEHNFGAGTHLVVDYLFGSVVSVFPAIAEDLPEDMGREITAIVQKIRDQLRDALYKGV